ncbi:MAG TPA: TIGR04442 family protein [Thermoanaerobaculia bacterium]|nr:TIGR04442 family protein [Thermoanaerobaculia bacterium]
MIQAIVHHGLIGSTVEYFATVSGPDLDKRFFFEQIQRTTGQHLNRYFGGGSEILLSDQGVQFSGNGGIFGEYMFGGHFPVQDLLNDEVVNRLVLLGGMYAPNQHELTFTPKTSGFETYEDLFLHGNAVANYFFFVDDHGLARTVVERQERTLKAVGKLLKRSLKVGRGNFLDLGREVLEALNEPRSTLFLLRVIHRMHQQFYNACKEAYTNHRSLANLADLISADLGPEFIDSYQRERIQIDVIYHHPENQELIDEYKRVLAASSGTRIGPSERARLMRLRTLSLRNEVPLSIFDTLEEIVLQGTGHTEVQATEESDYIRATREILEGFLLGKTINKKLSANDTLQLMENKQKAAANRDQGFEEILLETGRLIDERAMEEEDFERMESFSELITFFDRFDHTSTLVNKLAFMDDVEMSPEQIRSILGNMHVFEQLRRGLFQSLFIDPIVSNQYTLSFGRRKLFALMLGLMSIDHNEASLTDVAGEISIINRQERAYFALYRLARKRMATFYLELNTSEGRDTFRKEIAGEVARDHDLRELNELVDENLLDDVITKIRLEAFYINQLFPKIVEDQDGKLRSDFLQNSGLDRFQVEELESEYFELRSFPAQLLQSLRDSTAEVKS